MIVIFLLSAMPDAARSEEPAPQASAPDCRRSVFRTVIDVGHTVEVPGADSARGVPEFAFNLKLADQITQTLRGDGFDKTVRLITATPPWRGLVERAERANKLRADLFISIHHDSVPDNLLQSWEYEGQQHQFSDRFKGFSIFISKQNADPEGSLEFGHALGTALQARGLHFTPHYTLPLMGKHRHELVDGAAGVYRYDQLVVLRDTRMPAVLLEAGSIVNRQEELELASPDRRALISAAVAQAVTDFCAARSPLAKAPAKRPPLITAHPNRVRAAP